MAVLSDFEVGDKVIPASTCSLAGNTCTVMSIYNSTVYFESDSDGKTCSHHPSELEKVEDELKPGDTVIILPNPTHNRSSDGIYWSDSMDTFVGDTFVLDELSPYLLPAWRRGSFIWSPDWLKKVHTFDENGTAASPGTTHSTKEEDIAMPYPAQTLTDSKLTADERLAIQQGITDSAGNLNSAGKDLIMIDYWNEHSSAILKRLRAAMKDVANERAQLEADMTADSKKEK